MVVQVADAAAKALASVHKQAFNASMRDLRVKGKCKCPAPLIIVAQKDEQLARAWWSLIAITRADQIVVLLLHREVADSDAKLEWVSDGTCFEGISRITPDFSIDTVVRACAAIYPKCRRLSVFATTGQLSAVIKRLTVDEPPIVLLTSSLLETVASNDKQP